MSAMDDPDPNTAGKAPDCTDTSLANGNSFLTNPERAFTLRANLRGLRLTASMRFQNQIDYKVAYLFSIFAFSLIAPSACLSLSG